MGTYRYNSRKELIGYDYAKPYSLFETMKTLVHEEVRGIGLLGFCNILVPISYNKRKKHHTSNHFGGARIGTLDLLRCSNRIDM